MTTASCQAQDEARLCKVRTKFQSSQYPEILFTENGARGLWLTDQSIFRHNELCRVLSAEVLVLISDHRPQDYPLRE